MENLGEYLARWRKRAGLNQKDAAKALGRKRVSLSNWERGVSVPSTAKLIKALALYGVPEDEWGDALHCAKP